MNEPPISFLREVDRKYNVPARIGMVRSLAGWVPGYVFFDQIYRIYTQKYFKNSYLFSKYLFK